MPDNFRSHLYGIYKALKAQIDLINSSIGHRATEGSENEEAIRELLRGCLPQIYGVGSGMIIGTDGAVSKQIDIIVYDASRPNFAVGQNSRVFLADHVLAAIEIKTTYGSGSDSPLTQALKNIESVKKLKVAPDPWFELHVDEVTGECSSKQHVPTPPLGIIFFFGTPSTQGALDYSSFYSTMKDSINRIPLEFQPDLLMSLDHAFIFENSVMIPSKRTPDSQRFMLVSVQTTDTGEHLSLNGLEQTTKGVLNLTGFDLTDGSNPRHYVIDNNSRTSQIVAITDGQALDLEPLAYRVGFWGTNMFLMDSFRAFLHFFYELDQLLKSKRPNRRWSLKHYFGASFVKGELLPPKEEGSPPSNTSPEEEAR